MFIYSRREGTVADRMENQIPEEIKHKRFDKLKDLYDGAEYQKTTKKIHRNNTKNISRKSKMIKQHLQEEQTQTK